MKKKITLISLMMLVSVGMIFAANGKTDAYINAAKKTNAEKLTGFNVKTAQEKTGFYDLYDTVYYYEAFEVDTTADDWTVVSTDGDDFSWERTHNDDVYEDFKPFMYANSWDYFFMSKSYDETPLVKEDYLISPYYDLTTITDNLFLSFYVKPTTTSFEERLLVLVSTTENAQPADFTDTIYNAIVPDDLGYSNILLDMNKYKGQSVHVAFVHANDGVSDQVYSLMLDDIALFTPVQYDIELVEMLLSSDSVCDKGANETISFKLKNYGGSDVANLPIVIEVFRSDAGDTVYLDTIRETITETIPALGEYTFVYENYDMSINGTYDFIIYHELEGDTIVDNDVLTMSYYSYPSTIELYFSPIPSPYNFDKNWYLVDNSNDSLIMSGKVESGGHKETICVPDDKCYYFMLQAAVGEGMTYYVTDYDTITEFNRNDTVINGEDTTYVAVYDTILEPIGEHPMYDAYFHVKYNDQLVGSDTGNFGAIRRVYGVGGQCPATDLEAIGLYMPRYQRFDTLDITGTILNVGTDTIKSFDVVYMIDDFVSDPYTVTDTAIASSDYFTFVHDQPYIFNENKVFDVVVYIDNVNGTKDQDTTNNWAGISSYVSNKFADRKVLVEVGTNTGCYSCVDTEEKVDELAAEKENMYTVQYHYAFPYDNDKFYNFNSDAKNAQARRILNYQHSNAPTYLARDLRPLLVVDGMDMDGGVALEDLSSYIDSRASYPSPLHFENVKAEYDDKTLYVTGNIKAAVDVADGMAIYAVVKENNVYDFNAPNGKTTYNHILRAMLPGMYGGGLAAIGEDEIYPFDLSGWTIPINVKKENMKLLLFVQDPVSFEIVQSIEVDVTLGVDDIDLGNDVTIYPNPSNGQFNITNLEKGAVLNVINAMGSVVYSEVIENNDMLRTIDLSAAVNGIYFVQVQTAEGTFTKKIMINE